jgi:DHA1 family bicyclomycin/chloramphenicol resistance-like MFS transporter
VAASSLTVSRWLLAAISSLSPFGISIMVPLVPMLSLSMAHSVSELQYLFSIYVIGLAVSQPIFGLITDRIGRRTVLLSGFGVFVLSSILLMFADTLAMMILLRFLQAVGVGVGTVVARGIIRDHLPPDEALKAFALLTAAMGFTPVIAPVVGGFLAPLLGLKSVFLLLAIVGAGLLLLCFHSIPKDTAPDSGARHNASIKGYLSVLRSRAFWGHTGAFGFLQGMVFTLMASGSVLFEEQFGLSITRFSLVWGGSALVYVLGSFLLSRLSALGSPRWQHTAAIGMLLVSLCTAALILWQGLSFGLVVVSLFSSMLLSGILTPTTMYGAVNAVPLWSGSAAGLSSSVGMTMAGLFSWLGAAAYETDPALIMLCFGGAGCGFVACWWVAHHNTSSPAL